MTDSPESVREMIEESEAVGAPFYLVGLIDMLTRYADLLEQGNARIRELEDRLKKRDFSRERIRLLQVQIAEHERTCAGTWVRCSEQLPEDEQYHEVIYESGVVDVAEYFDHEWRLMSDEGPASVEDHGEVTHWREEKGPQR